MHREDLHLVKELSQTREKIINEEQIQEEKSEQKTNLVVDEGIKVPCAPNHREIPLLDMRLWKLEVPIFKG